MVGIAPVGREEPVRPEVSDLTLSLVGQGSCGEVLDALDQGGAQHLGHRPELADGQRARGLVRLKEREEVPPGQTQVRMGDEFLRDTVDARQTPVGPTGKHGQLLAETPGEVQLDVARVAFDQVSIVKDPLSGRSHTLLQPTRLEEIRGRLMDPLAGSFEPVQQLGVPRRLRVQPVVQGQAPGMLLELCRGERHSRAPHVFDKTLTLWMQDKDGRRSLATFPE